MTEKLIQLVAFVKDQFPGQDFIPLHAPYFGGNEKKYVLDPSIQLLFLQ